MTICDRTYHGTPDGSPGPFGLRLQCYGRILGVVFGNFGEGSMDATNLLDLAARGIATRSWAQMGARDFTEALAATRHRLYVKWGFTAARARAVALRETFAELLGRPNDSTAAYAAANQKQQRERRAHYAAFASGINTGGSFGL